MIGLGEFPKDGFAFITLLKVVELGLMLRLTKSMGEGWLVGCTILSELLNISQV